MDPLCIYHDPFMAWVASSSPAIVVPVFQLLGKHHPAARTLSNSNVKTALDSLHVHWKLFRDVPSWKVFDLPEDIQEEAATWAWEWFLGLDRSAINSELVTLEVMFPYGYDRRCAVLARHAIHGPPADGVYVDPRLFDQAFVEPAPVEPAPAEPAPAEPAPAEPAPAEPAPAEPAPIHPVDQASIDYPPGRVPPNDAQDDLQLPGAGAFPAVGHPQAVNSLATLLKVKTKTYSPLFGGFKDLQDCKTAYSRLNDKSEKRRTSVPDDLGSPNDWAGQTAVGGRIFAAIIDFSQARDKPNSPARAAVLQASDLELQLIAWDIFVSDFKMCYLCEWN
jgi:hypothetical protein